MCNGGWVNGCRDQVVILRPPGNKLSQHAREPQLHFTKHESGIRIHETPWLTTVFAPFAVAYLAFALWDLHEQSALASVRGFVLGAAAVLFTWSFLTLRLVSIIHFDRDTQVVRWRRMTLLRRERAELEFDQIDRLAIVSSEARRDDRQRLVVITKSGEEMTLVPRFNTELERDVNLLTELRALLADR